MPTEEFRQRVAQIARVPPELFEYQRWLDGRRACASGPRDYLFSDRTVRFEPRRDDVVVPLGRLSVVRVRKQVRLQVSHPPLEVPLDGVASRDAERIVAAVDGRRSLLEIRFESGVSRQAMARFLRAAFGRVVMAPRAVEALEQALPGLEVTRFPSAPYGIDRAYWQNMVDLRSWFVSQRSALDTADRFDSLLRELHVIALMGRGLDSFYQPASPGADRTVAPGAWLEAAARVERTGRAAILFEGPRVNASLVGGRGYHEALYQSLDDPAALGDERTVEIDGRPWGEVVVARADKDAEPGPWFVPPRPLESSHFELARRCLRRALDAADRGQPEDAVAAAAQLHQSFVRLHPFHCANQSVAMSLVNEVLRRAVGAGIPHLLLDHFALRLAPAAYAQLFARAVRAFAIADPNPASRLLEAQARARRSFAMVERLAAARSRDERTAAIAADPDGARWALLVD